MCRSGSMTAKPDTSFVLKSEFSLANDTAELATIFSELEPATHDEWLYFPVLNS